MNSLLLLILGISGIDLLLLGFYSVSKVLRRKNSKGIVLDSGIKTKMLNTISEMNKRIADYEINTVHIIKYNDLVKKYNVLLNSHRELNKKNDALKLRIGKLKQKIY